MHRRFLITAMALPALFSCNVGEPFSLEDNPDTVVEEIPKAVNSAEGAATEEFLIRIGKGEAVPEGIEAERLFRPVPGKEELERKHGLDRWYVVRPSRGMELRAAALAVSEIPAVESIEFESSLTRPFESDHLELPAVPFTKAGNPVTMNDPLLKSQWFLYNNGDKSVFGSTNVAGTDVSIRDAWRLETGDPSVIVAVVDEGVKYTHPDLKDNMWKNSGEIPDNGKDDDGNGYVDDVYGYNFAADGAISWNLSGDEGHGTHVAGLVAATNNNGIGVSSVAGGSGSGDGVRIMSCQIFSGTRRDGVAAAAKAIKYAADNGASVLQCSFGLGSYYSDKAFSEGLSAVKAAFDYFRDPANANCSAVQGNIVVISAGNGHNSKAEYPGAYRDYICVSAVSQDNLPAWYTNYGSGVNIASPGGDNTLANGLTMLSTVPSETDATKSDYAFMHGTSMATPVVSGIAALGLSYAKRLNRKFSRDEYEALVLSSVNPLEDMLTGTKKGPSSTMDLASYRGKMGTGVIDAWKLLLNIEGVPFTTVKTGQEAVVDLSAWFGSDANHLTWLGVEIPEADRKAIGLSGDAVLRDGKLRLTCMQHGCARLTVTAIAGGSIQGSDTEMGGKPFSRAVSIVSRSNVSANDGWL
ncbi:MAG: S8 family serine peptidase [Bacteroidales bacterium]|nr:S8 family serine peptidase [Bacteroidales bacterium]